MESLSIEQISNVVDGKILSKQQNNTINHICINSNDAKPGSLFVPIKGENVDAHDFLDSAFKNGAVACLCEKDVVKKTGTLIKVENCKDALQSLAQFYRRQFSMPVIGVTGSVGKTSTKEMISSVLSQKINVMKTAENFNGQLGVPLTLFNLSNQIDVAVVEMGISLYGEMEKISRITKPNIAVINNIGVSHIENLGTKENILKEKLKIADYIGDKGKLFFNGDDIILKNFNFSNYNNASFGLDKNCDARATDVKIINDSTTFRFLYKNFDHQFLIPLLGRHNVYNALVSIMIGLELGVKIDKIELGLKNYRNLSRRQQIFNLKKCTLIDDSYNASPDSMKSAIDVLNLIAKNKKTVAILSDMLELGDQAEKNHVDVGKYLAKKNICELITVGNLSKNIAKGFNQTSKTKKFNTNDQVIDYLLNCNLQGCCILVKGSRGMHMEQIVKKLLEEF